MLGMLAPAARAQTHTVLYSFAGGTDGSFPSALIRDKAGNLYGTTFYGGRLACRPPFATGCGTVFEIDASDKKSVLYNFSGGADGANPDAGVIRDAAGNLYGTTNRRRSHLQLRHGIQAGQDREADRVAHVH